MGSSHEVTAPQSTQHVTATVHATASRTDASIHLTLAATPAQTQSSSTSMVKFEPLDEPLSEVTFTATLSLVTQPCATVEAPVMVANESKIALKEENALSLHSSANAKVPDAAQVHSESTPLKSAIKQTRNTTRNDETCIFSVPHSTTPVQADPANNDREKRLPTKGTVQSPGSQSAPKTPTKPISHEVEDLVSRFDDLHVDRSKSQRQSNKLSHIPSPHSVRIQDPSGRAIVYDNIHFPEAYINKIQSQKPDLVCSIQTSPSSRSPSVSAQWNGSGSNGFDSDDETPVRLSVDRTMSTRSNRIHRFSNSPSSKKVIVDHGNGVQLEYDNIHYPDRYMEKIRQNNPRAKCWVE
ncbi:hypothetical protein HDU80_006639 [Chytriomyces hyalinus]|nr:hypothetical protein HDU80_006639 [Chytriomyces hyalinus]